MQYQGTPPIDPDLKIQLLRIERALRAAVNHQPDGLTFETARFVSDDDLLRIKGIGRKALKLIRSYPRPAPE